jgi:hypothetical protein
LYLRLFVVNTTIYRIYNKMSFNLCKRICPRITQINANKTKKKKIPSKTFALCSLLFALCSLLSALCSLLFALCSLLSALCFATRQTSCFYYIITGSALRTIITLQEEICMKQGAICMKLNKSYINVRFIRKHLFWGAAVLAACFFSLTCSSSDDILDQDGGPKVKPGGTTLVDGAVTFKNGWESEYFNGTLKDDPGTPYTNYNPVSTGNGNRAYIDFAVKTAELTQWRDVDMPAWQALEDAWAAYLSGDSEEEPGEPRRDPPVEPKKTVAYLPGSPVENDDGSSTVVGSVPEWDYHIFKGWKVNPGTPEAFDLRADTVLTESVIAVAQWDEIAAGRPYYTVTFEKNDGQGLMEKRLAFPTVNDTEKQAGDPSKYSVFKIVAADASGGIVAGNNVLPEFSRLYYDRSTWVTKNGTTETPVEPSNIEYSGDTTIYQKWTPQIAVITFNAGGIVSTPPQLTGLELPKLASGGINAAGAQLPAYPGTVSHNSEDYIFLGWYDAEDGGTQIGNDTPISDTAKTLYARWRKQNHYSATFYYN